MGTCSGSQLGVVVFLLSHGLTISAYQLGNNPYHRTELLDQDGKYLLEWEVDWVGDQVTFTTTVATTGWIGFGLARNNSFQVGSDAVIGGVGEDGESYFTDGHLLSQNWTFASDRKQNWVLHFAKSNGSFTTLQFSRKLDTCDPEDYPITLNRIILLWAYGRDGNEHPEARGTFPIHLLDPDYCPKVSRNGDTATPTLITASNRSQNIPEDTQVWSVVRDQSLPRNRTSYFCFLHKAPSLQRKHHLNGFDVHFPDEDSRSRTHHMLMFRCHAPAGQRARAVFQPHVGDAGEPCYRLMSQSELKKSVLRPLCSEFYMGWGIGGKTYFLPDNIGFTFGETEDEYYFFQIHYDNHMEKANLQAGIRFDFFYTSQLRPNEGGILGLNHGVPGGPESFLIPPRSTSHRIFGHCGPECTRRRPWRGARLTSNPCFQFHNSHDKIECKI